MQKPIEVVCTQVERTEGVGVTLYVRASFSPVSTGGIHALACHDFSIETRHPEFVNLFEPGKTYVIQPK